jgi:hypothetical protein
VLSLDDIVRAAGLHGHAQDVIGIDHAEEDRVLRDHDGFVVEFAIERAPLLMFVLETELVDALDHVIEVAHVGAAGALAAEARGQAFEHLADLVGFQQLGVVQAGDEDAEVIDRFDQAGGLKLEEGFADDGLGDAKALGELLLGEA